MFTLTSDIHIGDFRAVKPSRIEWHTAVGDLTDTCTITLPLAPFTRQTQPDTLLDWMTWVYADLQTLTTLLASSPVAGNGAPLGVIFTPATPAPDINTYYPTSNRRSRSNFQQRSDLFFTATLAQLFAQLSFMHYLCTAIRSTLHPHPPNIQQQTKSRDRAENKQT